jgi:glycosyltransferase involved in cell wall biosynthesis
VKFSVITISLNPGPDLELTVASVLRQEYADFEVLIKDGGSTDGTELLTWPDPRIRRITCPDTGIFDAMNQALSMARGEYIHFLNAGDTFVDPQVLIDAATAIEESPDVEFFYGDVRKTGSRRGYARYPDKLSRRYLFMNGICHQAWILQRNTYVRLGCFEADYGVAGDARFLLRMLVGESTSYKHLSRFIAQYKGGGVSTSANYRLRSRIAFDSLRRELYPSKEYHLYRSVERSRFAAMEVSNRATDWLLGMRSHLSGKHSRVAHKCQSAKGVASSEESVG